MMYLSQEVISKDQQLKTQMAVSFQDDETKNSEKVWQESGFFDDIEVIWPSQKPSFLKILYAMSIRAEFHLSSVVVKQYI